MTDQKRPQKIYSEEVKDRQTSHWDWDYLPREQIDEAVDATGPADASSETSRESDSTTHQEGWASRIVHAINRLFGGTH